MSEPKSITSVKFLYLSPEEIRKLSAVEITEVEIFAQLQSAPIPGGLYDLRMGPVERGDTCKTCGLQADCPGHLGHIELACEIYNPFLMKQLYDLVRKACTRCFRFRHSAAITAKFVDKFSLLSRGHEIEMSDVPLKMLDETKRSAIEKDCLLTGSASQSMHWTNASDDTTWVEQFDESKTHSERNIKHLKDLCADGQRRSHFSLTKSASKDAPMSATGGMGSSITTGEVGSWTRLVTEYLNSIPTTNCENCGLPSHTFRKDGYSRLFMKPRKASKEEEKYLTPSYVHSSLIALLWKNESAILKYLFPGAEAQKEGVFFLRNVAVPPNRFRPLRAAQGAGDSSFLPANTQALKSIMEASEAVKSVIEHEMADEEERDGKAAPANEELGTVIIALQDRVNTYMDSTKTGRSAHSADVNPGVRQLLERKQGLFRMKMMGKRVNYACRSVISPDINLETNQIGLPRFAAMQLSVPEPVFAHNVDYLRQLVLNGPDVYPGATAVQYPDGKVVSLVGRSAAQREGLAKSLYVQAGDGRSRVVMRHVRNGDPLLVNRQPTLHKPGIMAMLVRILHAEKTIRMHYANCNTFNADFDGDEINLHCPQDPVARAEALFIANADTQFLGPTAGNPLRGLIQDNIASAALLTSRGTFLTLDQVYQLLYAGLRAAMEGDAMVNISNIHKSGLRVSCYRDLAVRKGAAAGLIEITLPAILKPVPMWSGKQVMTILLRSLVRMCAPNAAAGRVGLNHVGKSRTPGDLWGGALDGNKEEEQILIRDSELLMGVIDKNSVGANAGGLAHVVYELCGPSAAGLLMTGVSRMFTLYLQWRGFTCCMRDLLITPESEATRAKLLGAAQEGGWGRIRTWVQDRLHTIPNGGSNMSISTLAELQRALGLIVKSQGAHGADDLELLEKMMLGNSSEFWGKTIDSVLPAGLQVSFPTNGMSAMVMTGAKGSKINQSQISCLLGQQELEGHRVPLMCTMRSHPSFAEFDLSSRAGGFVADRFLTGVRPQEFFFHCMAGREGLIDTAVKTARSGYLQRCLVKHMECLVVQYDLTVRDADSSIVQFLYGEDGLDILKSSYLKMPQVFRNNPDFLRLFRATKSDSGAETGMGPDKVLAVAYVNWLRKRGSARRAAELSGLVDKSDRLTTDEKEFMKLVIARGDADPIEGVLNPLRFLGAVSNRHMAVVKDMAAEGGGDKWEEGMSELFSKKFQASMADAGECVGTLAAQGMGEPSTQMTLNTFHLAGHGGANVTLGIPRLREIVQTASRRISTPSMFIPLPSVTEAETLQGMMTRIALKDIVAGSTVEETVVCTTGGEKKRRYKLKIDLVNLDQLNRAYPQLTRRRIEEYMQSEFRTKLDRDVRNFLRVSMQMSTQSQRQINDDTGLRVGARVGGGAADDDDEPVRGEDDAVEKVKVKSRPAAAGGRVRKTDDDDAADVEDESDGEGSDAGGQYDDNAELDEVRKDVANEEDDDEDTTIGGKKVIKNSQENDGVDGDDNIVRRRVKDAQEMMSDSDNEMHAKTEDVVAETPDEADMVVEEPIKVQSVTNDQNAIFGNSGRLVKDSFVIESRELTLADRKVSRKILILEVVEELCSSLYIQQTVGITKVHVTNQGPKVGITTEGANIEFAWGLDGIDHSQIYTNDICKMLDHYGVESCRASIIKEVQNVFGHYGISVDPRHLCLIADYMTHQGGYRPFNRGGMANHSSPILKMSFETSMGFLSAACNNVQMDSLKSPAAAIVVGKLVRVGTGVFDVLNDSSVNSTDVGTVKRQSRKNVATPVGAKRLSAIKEEAGSGKRSKTRFSFD